MQDENHESPSFSAWLKRQRRILDITRDELGRRAHCSPETIKKIESDERLPSKELAGLMADALGVPIEQRESFVQFARGSSVVFLQKSILSTPSDALADTSPLPTAPAFLHTKLFSPIARPNLVLRPRLIALLKMGLTRPLTLIASSAGFGKTTLAAHITTFEELARTAWLSLDGDDNDPTLFLTYFIRACQRLYPNVGESGLASLRAPQVPSAKNTLAALANEMARATVPPQSMALVLDDYHVITTPEIHEALAYFIENIPLHLHVVLVSRADPPLPLARWRARNLLTEIRTDTLRFNQAEAATFFGQTAGLALLADQVAALEARTEGWVAGLQLAALSIQGVQDQAGFIVAFSGSNRFVLDYLMDEVLSQQPTAIQDFLLQTSVLGQLCGDLCEALTQQAGGQNTLEQLERGNLFVIALDHNRQWFRYHHLFADVLQSRLKQAQPTQVAVLHHRASVWFERHAQYIEAVQHGLAAQDYDRVADLLETHAVDFLLTGHAARVRDWLSVIPAHFEQERPRLRLARIWMLLGIGRRNDAELSLDALERMLQGNTGLNTNAIKGEIAAQRAVAHGAYWSPQALGFAHTALALLPPASPVRSLAYLSMGTAYYNAGELAEAHRTFAQTLLQVGLHRGLLAQQVGLHSSLGLVLLAQGDLTNTVVHCAEAAELAGSEGEVLPNGASTAHANLGVVALYRNKLDEAEQHLNRALAIAERYLGADTEAYVTSNLALLMRIRGQWPRALELTDRAEAQTPQQAPLTQSAIKALRASIWLAQGEVALAADWADTLDIAFEQTRPRMTPLDADRFIRISIWMAQQQWAKAEIALTKLLADAKATGHSLFMLQANAMLAIVHATQGHETQALTTLERALALAEPEGIVRFFLDEGTPMQQLLAIYRAQTSSPIHAFAEVVWEAFVSPSLG